MGHFKRPLILTGIAVALALILSIAASTWIFLADGSAREKRERARLLGGGLGVATALVVAPIWLMAAAKVRKERDQARDVRDKIEGGS